MISSPPGAARTLRGVFPGRLILILVLLIVASSAFEVMGCLVKERRALLDIKASMNKFDASALQDWGNSTLDDCCRWRGIACDPLTARVVKIDFYGEIWSLEKKETWNPNLTMLAEFGHLEILNLGLNLMGGEIPQAVCGLKKLKILDLSFNDLTGPLPPCLCDLSALAELHLAFNRLQGVVPPCFGSFHSLTLLSLFDNQFHGDYAPWVCSMQSLTQLQLSYDTNSGSIPACLENLHKLEFLKLGGRNLTGTIPSSIFHNLTNLGTLEINSNELEGTFKFSSLANLSKLKEVDISSGEKFDVDTESPASWVPSFQLSFLSIRYCTVNNFTGRSVPTFLWGQRAMKILFLRDASITGTPPIGLFCNSSLGSLDLRSKNISGLLDVPCRNASDSAYEINLTNNLISGPLPESIALSFPKLNILRIAGNKLEGQIPPSLANRQLVLIDLSYNRLSGELPHAFTRNQSLLFYLSVAYNELQGEMLPVDAFMPKLAILIVNNNRFTGSLLPRLANSSLLSIIYAAKNQFTENFSQGLPLLPYLRILSMNENRIEGYIPRTLCQLRNIRILDLHQNNLSGEIPRCLQNISSWNSSIELNDEIWLDSGIADPLLKFFSKKLLLNYTSDILFKVTILDLSENKIHGVIPSEIGDLKGLRTLALSRNRIQGSIPVSIANMDKLESLDLSHNRLSGTIPKEMVQLSSLSYLSLAFNNLSGTIPFIKQLSTFTEENFEGNPGLCGRPLKKDCFSDVEITNASRNDTRRLEDVLFYTFCVLLFTLGFWGYLAGLFFSLRWRMKYFKVIDGFYDMYLRNL